MGRRPRVIVPHDSPRSWCGATSVMSDYCSMASAKKLDEAEIRWMALAWAEIVSLQTDRFDESLIRFHNGVTAARFRESFKDEGEPLEWVKEYEDADGVLTQHDIWVLGADRHFLLLAIAQLIKCVDHLPKDGLPTLRDAAFLRKVRNIEEHWEDPEGPSIVELRKSMPDIAPGQIAYTKKYAVIGGNVTLEQVADWAQEVDQKLRDNAIKAGAPYRSNTEPF